MIDIVPIRILDSILKLPGLVPDHVSHGPDIGVSFKSRLSTRCWLTTWQRVPASVLSVGVTYTMPTYVYWSCWVFLLSTRILKACIVVMRTATTVSLNLFIFNTVVIHSISGSQVYEEKLLVFSLQFRRLILFLKGPKYLSFILFISVVHYDYTF